MERTRLRMRALLTSQVLTNWWQARIILRWSEFFTGVNLRTNQNKPWLRALTIAFCALVFFFALHAKTAVYNGGNSAKLSPATSSKLWSTGQKMETKSFATGSGALFWMALFCLFAPYLRPEPRVHSAFVIPFPSTLRLRHLHRFLRPPPVLA